MNINLSDEQLRYAARAYKMLQKAQAKLGGFLPDGEEVDVYEAVSHAIGILDCLPFEGSASQRAASYTPRNPYEDNG